MAREASTTVLEYQILQTDHRPPCSSLSGIFNMDVKVTCYDKGVKICWKGRKQLREVVNKICGGPKRSINCEQQEFCLSTRCRYSTSHWCESLNVAATPEPSLWGPETHEKLKFGATDSVRSGALQLLSSQTSWKAQNRDWCTWDTSAEAGRGLNARWRSWVEDEGKFGPSRGGGPGRRWEDEDGGESLSGLWSRSRFKLALKLSSVSGHVSSLL